MPVESRELQAEAWGQEQLEGLGMFSEEQMDEFKEVTVIIRHISDSLACCVKWGGDGFAGLL